jgi:hypothetical protein
MAHDQRQVIGIGHRIAHRLHGVNGMADLPGDMTASAMLGKDGRDIGVKFRGTRQRLGRCD